MVQYIKVLDAEIARASTGSALFLRHAQQPMRTDTGRFRAKLAPTGSDAGALCLRFFAKGLPVRLTLMFLLFVALAGCSGQESAGAPTPTPRTPTVAAGTTPGRVALSVTVGKPFARFLATICHALSAGNARTIIGSLPYFQYNSGLYFGTLGSGEGQTANPNLMRTWLSGSQVRCRYFSPGIEGHGSVLTSGWKQPAPWSLIEMDLFNGHWKLNDFTFGGRRGLWAAMQADRPVLAYHG